MSLFYKLMAMFHMLASFEFNLLLALAIGMDETQRERDLGMSFHFQNFS